MSTQAISIPRSISFLGMSLHPMTIDDLNSVLTENIERNSKCIIANHNMHNLYLLHRDAALREFYRYAEWTHIDGMPIVALARLYGHKLRREHRVTYVDWLGPLMTAAARHQWRVLHLGGAPGVAEAGADLLRKQHTGLQILAMHGFFDQRPDGRENQEVLNRIARYRPNVLMVGMGAPRQELWIKENFPQISANVILPCGAAMDYVAGTIPTPPRWAGRVGLEWAFRLAAEPHRLWYRYLVEPWFMVGLIMQDAVSRLRLG